MKTRLEKLRKIKTSQWALLLIVLGLAISFLFPTRQKEQDANTAGDAEGSAQEMRLAQVLSKIEGAGEVDVVIWYEGWTQESSAWLWNAEENAEGGMPRGAVVVAQGADDLMVRLKLAQAVETLLGLDAQAVEVFAMKQEGEEIP